MFKSLGTQFRAGGSVLKGSQRRSSSEPIKAAASAPASDAGNNILGDSIRSTYGVGSDTTIRWGLLKSKVIPPKDKNGRTQTWEQYRRATEGDRKKLREQFADRLEVIAYPERKRRLIVGLGLGAVTVALGAWLVAIDASALQRAWITPSLVFSLGFIDSSIQGLCTESWAGAWDVDDTGLEYMPNKAVAERIQKKVLTMYLRDTVLCGGILAAFCFWPV